MSSRGVGASERRSGGLETVSRRLNYKQVSRVMFLMLGDVDGFGRYQRYTELAVNF